MSGHSPNRLAKSPSGARLGKSASMETIEVKAEADWEELEGLESESPFEAVKPFFKKNYNAEGAEVAARSLQRTPMAGGDAAYVQIGKEEAYMAQTEENGTAQKGGLQPQGYLGNALRTGVHLFDTHMPRFLEGPAQVKSSTLPQTTSSMRQKERLENSKVGDHGIKKQGGATTKRIESTLQTVNVLTESKICKFQEKKSIEEYSGKEGLPDGCSES